ncbi:hypothetical protein ABTZ58_39305 [Streptomyces sp. NPDC094143]|uniref:hypothetical protein n=1 Tax=Streptomyces sp. NPDC094143 TaxID=3155310 RepID=UPI00331C8717
MGRVGLSRTDTSGTPLSLLEVTDRQACTYRSTFYHDFTLVIEKPPGGGAPLVLCSTKPVITRIDKFTQFPPRGVGDRLREQVDFAPPGEPDQVVAQLLDLSFTWS